MLDIDFIVFKDEKRLVYCSQCQYSTKNSFTLRKHIAKKHSIQPPKQKVCNFIYKSYLE